MEYNHQTMMREVWCPLCKYTYSTNALAPICEKCNTPLITVVKNTNGEKLTGDLKNANHDPS